MKAKRHAKILDIISKQDIETQEELLVELEKNGFNVTQATVSRDIKELQLVKIQVESGGYRYSVSSSWEPANMSFKFHSVFKESVLSIDYVENIVVIKCYVGMANAACASLDSINWNGLVGTLAGDDTIFCLMRDKNQSVNFVKQLKKLLKSKK